MTETAWIPALSVLGAGAVLGGVLAWWMHRRRAALPSDDRLVRSSRKTQQESPDRRCDAPETQAKRAEEAVQLADLEERRDELIAQLRELEDLSQAGGPAVANEARATLEQEAARVFRDIHLLKANQHAPTRGEGSSRLLRRLALGGGVIIFFAVVGLVVWKTARPRREGMSPTGNTVVQGQGTMGMAADPQGNARSATARPLVARETERLKQARAHLQAHPEKLDALIAYGYAVSEAGGWVEAFQTAQRILETDADHADGLIQMAMVRAAMGENDTAASLVARVLEQNPQDLRALEVQGRLALRQGDLHQAIALWERAKGAGGSAELFDGLIATAQRERAESGPSATSTLPPGHPPVEAVHPPVEPAQVAERLPPGKTQDITGTIRVTGGAALPQGAPLYVMLRPAGDPEGAPIVVKRIASATFPLAFSVGPGDAMMGGALPSEVLLSVRVDADHDVTTRQSEDWVGEVEGAVALGTRDIEVTLRRP